MDLLAGRVMPSYYPSTHHCVEDPLLLNDLLLLAEFLWLQILFESLCSAQLVASSYRGNQQMGFFDKGQRGSCLHIDRRGAK